MITSTTTFVRTGTPLPGTALLESGSNVSGWAQVANNPDGRQLERDLHASGWTLHFMAGEIARTAIGFDRKKNLRSAVKSLIANARAEHCNCLQIEAVEQRSFCGVPYVQVRAHKRHAQSGSTYSA